MQVALGGETLNQYSQFVLTKANACTPREKRVLAQQKSNPGSVYNQLAYHQLGWGVVLAGLGNVEELIANMQTTATTLEGIGVGMVNEKSESLDRVQNNAKQLELWMNYMKAEAERKAGTKDDIFRWILQQQKVLHASELELEKHRSDCTGDDAAQATKAINTAKAELCRLENEDLSNKEALEAAQRSMEKYQKQVIEELKKLHEMKSFGAAFKTLCGNIASAASGLQGRPKKGR